MQSTPAPTRKWTLIERFGFRFFFLFFIVYIAVHNGAFPFIDELTEPILTNGLQRFIPWFGNYVLKVPYQIDVTSTGSSDTTYLYLVLLLIVSLAIVGCMVWSVFDSKRVEYHTLHQWLVVLIRYYIAFILLSYGFEKVYKLQFPFPELETLAQPYGESTPMKLAWTFMGYSRLYNYFIGFAEILGGVLLLFRRTVVLGALVSLMVMLNVSMLNYSFDIPVKLFATMLVAMCLFLLAPNTARLYHFFVLNQTIGLQSASLTEHSNPRISMLGRTVKWSLIGFVLYTDITENQTFVNEDSDTSPKPPLYGIYRVERFVSNRDTLATCVADSIRWSRIIINKYEYMSLKLHNEEVMYYTFKADTSRHTFQLVSFEDSTDQHTFAYTLPDPERLVISGLWNKDTLQVHFKKYDVTHFPLIKTGFNWINEYPNNQ
jgi:uncharacterized membrane protein YphA (DoxX/SURF4 family)